MAISTHRVTINPQDLVSWSRVDVINQLEDAFTWLGWHGAAETGLVCGVTSYTGGGTLSGDTSYYYYEDVRPISTSGIGSGASFYVARREDVGYVLVNRPGTNYAPGDTVTLSAEDIGGSVNGATDIELRVTIAGEVTGGLGYGITVTGTYDTEGTDRNGFVTGSNATITIREGDTLTFENFSNRDINIIQSGAHFGENYRPYYDYHVERYYEGLVFNVIGNRNGGNSGQITRWTPLPGQRGTYYVVDDFNSYGSFNPTIVVEPAPSGITTNSYGGSSGFYSKNITDTSEPWGVLKQTINASKTYGTTYRIFGLNNSNSNLEIWSGSSFFPDKLASSDSDSEPYYLTGHGYGYRLGGASNADISFYNIRNSYSSPISMDGLDNIRSTNDYLNIGGTTSRQLDLNIFRSSIDPRFAVLSFNIPTAAASKLRDRTKATFFLHNFENDEIFDLDHLFLGGYTEILPNTDDTRPYLRFRTALTGTAYEYSGDRRRYPALRTAEFGYAMIEAYNGPDSTYYDAEDNAYYYSNTNDNEEHSNVFRIYYRDSSRNSRSKTNPDDSSVFDNINRITSDSDFNAVIKGIPLNGHFLPVPYYIPDDFVLIDFYYNVPGVNIQQGDTITISGSEQYTVIQGSYNQSGSTKGILFCGRSV